jgi:hypothetical protein
MPSSSTKNRSPWCLGQLVTLVWWLGILATLVALLTRVIILEDWTGPIAPIRPVKTDAFISNLYCKAPFGKVFVNVRQLMYIRNCPPGPFMEVEKQLQDLVSNTCHD